MRQTRSVDRQEGRLRLRSPVRPWLAIAFVLASAVVASALDDSAQPSVKPAKLTGFWTPADGPPIAWRAEVQVIGEKITATIDLVREKLDRPMVFEGALRDGRIQGSAQWSRAGRTYELPIATERRVPGEAGAPEPVQPTLGAFLSRGSLAGRVSLGGDASLDWVASWSSRDLPESNEQAAVLAGVGR